MQNKLFTILLIIPLFFSACNYKRVTGNGNVVTETREIRDAHRIRLAGSMDVEITQGNTVSVKVEADENLQQYIITRMRDGYLDIRQKDNININTSSAIKVYITTDRLDQIRLTGSGNITGMSKFTGSDKLDIDILGSGNVAMEVNTPSVEAEISGSGSITLAGETRDQKVSINGAGNYTADALKAEQVRVNIAGSGDVRVFADALLDINIAGGGSIYYKGSPQIKQHIAGTGDIRKIE